MKRGLNPRTFPYRYALDNEFPRVNFDADPRQVCPVCYLTCSHTDPLEENKPAIP